MLGIDAREVRRQLEYTIMTDFVITNTDRHLNNFGFLYHPARHEIVGMAPVLTLETHCFMTERSSQIKGIC